MSHISCRLELYDGDQNLYSAREIDHVISHSLPLVTNINTTLYAASHPEGFSVFVGSREY